MFRKMKNRKGFTLVELVVVIAILGILAAIAVPRLLGFQTRARAQADRQSAVQVKNSLALLYSNGEITLTSGGTYEISTADAETVSGITAKRDVDGSGSIADADTIALVEELTGSVDVKGTQSIIVTATSSDGALKVTQPAGIDE